MPLSDGEFQTWILEAERHNRLEDYRVYEKYYLGQYDKLDLPKHIADCLATDVTMWANLCRPIIDTAVQYVCGDSIGITVESDDPLAEIAEKKLYVVYKRNSLLYRNMLKALRIMCKKGDVFLHISHEKDLPPKIYKRIIEKILFWKNYKKEYFNNIRIRVLNPAYVFPKYADNDYEELEMATIKYYDYTADGDQYWHAIVYYADIIQYWNLDIIEEPTEDEESINKQWKLESQEDNHYGFIPIIHIQNTIDDIEFGVSDLHDITKLQDMLIKTLTDFMLAMDYQAFQREYVIGAMSAPGMKHDRSPGVITELPNPEANVVFTPSSDMTAFIDAIKTIKALACETSQTPQIAIGNFEGGIPSGYALRIHYQPLEAKCNEKKTIIQDGLQELNRMIFTMAAIDGNPDYSGLETKIQFTSGLPIDKDNMVTTHEKQISMGTLSKSTAMQEEGVMDIEAEKKLIEEENTEMMGGTDRAIREAQMIEQTIAGLGLTQEPSNLTTEETAKFEEQQG